MNTTQKVDTNIQLNKFIPRQNHQNPTEVFNRYDLMVRHSFDWFLPTQVVVNTPQIVTPSTARVWRTNLYLLDGCHVVDYDGLYKARQPDFKGTHGEDEIYLIEIWGDEGTDGHVDYLHLGYAFIPRSELPKKLENRMAYPEDRISKEAQGW